LGGADFLFGIFSFVSFLACLLASFLTPTCFVPRNPGRTQKMASNLTGQVRSISLVTKAVANGDLGKTMEVDVSGEMLDLKVRFWCFGGWRKLTFFIILFLSRIRIYSLPRNLPLVRSHAHRKRSTRW